MNFASHLGIDISSTALIEKLLNVDIKVHWIDSTNNFWFEKQTGDGHEFIVVDASTGRQKLCFDHDRLASLLNASGETNLNKQALPISDLQFESDGFIVELTTKSVPSINVSGSFAEAALLELRKIRYRFDLELTKCGTVESNSIKLQAHDSSIVWAHDSQNGVFVRGFNLWLTSSSGYERQLTVDGVEHFAYGAFDETYQDVNHALRRRTKTDLKPQYVQWSPNSRYIVAMRLDLRRTPPRPILTEFASGQDDYMVTDCRHYPLVTDRDALVRSVTIIDTQADTAIQADISPELLQDRAPEHFNWGCLWWSRDETEVYLVTANEDGRAYGLVAVDIESGQTRTVVHEIEDKHYIFNGTDIYIDKPSIAVINCSQELIWYSQRSGNGQLYLYDIATGQLKNAITQGDWVVLQIMYVNEQKRIVYFTAADKEQGRHPHYSHLYSVGFDGGEPVLLTPEDAHHHFCGSANCGPQFSASGEYFVDSYSTVSKAPKVVIRRCDGSLAGTVLEVDSSPLEKLGWQPPEVFSVKAADNSTDLYGVIYKPQRKKDSAPLPIIEYTYPGPQGSYTPKGFMQGIQVGGFIDMQMMAEQGFAVVILDGRGTSGRSRDFRYAFLGTDDPFGAEDHKVALENLAQQDSQLDISRVGVFGASYGGYGAMRATLRYPDFYKVCVSLVGSHDYRYSGNPGLKRLFGLPGEKGKDYYHKISNTRLAGRLKGKLLLIYAELDHHVRLNQYFLLADALIRADKDFDALIVPNADHRVGLLPYAKNKWQQYFLDFLAKGRCNTK